MSWMRRLFCASARRRAGAHPSSLSRSSAQSRKTPGSADSAPKTEPNRSALSTLSSEDADAEAEAEAELAMAMEKEACVAQLYLAESKRVS